MQIGSVQRDARGRYEVYLAAPGRWELRRNGTIHSRYGTASSARKAAEGLERLRVLRIALTRLGLGVVGVLLGIGIVVQFRTFPNPEYAPAVAFAARLEGAYQSVVTGARSLDEFSLESDGFIGATVDGVPAFRIETGEQDVEPTEPARVSILMGEQDGTCYVVRWEEIAWPMTGILSPRLACSPAARPEVNSSYAQRASSTQPGVVYWAPVLPVERVQAGWFVPVLLGLLGAGSWMSVGMTLAALRYRSGGPAPIRWEV